MFSWRRVLLVLGGVGAIAGAVMLALLPARAETLAIQAVKAFPHLRLRRPVIFTHAGDGTNRIFIGSQQGVIHVLPHDESVTESATFLDLEARVFYQDTENEQGLLGLAFHPQFRENGQFFVFYSAQGSGSPAPSVVSRFHVSPKDPNRADPASEEVLLRIEKPFWNHTGGTLAFGPDGMLYIGLGDGGSANDPQGHGQNLGTLLGSILRIDIDHADTGRKYAVPKDNPFVNQPGAQPEIWAYGLRNVWRLAFDRQTGALWAADVGQDQWEEIDLIVKGGNYGWNLREGKHKFEKSKANTNSRLMEPIWEYDHNTGKSIIGGAVYRGRKLPELAGCYIYGDYVSGKLWALKYDETNARVVANYALADTNAPVMTFGEDEAGEIYFTDAFGNLFTLARSETAHTGTSAP